MTGILPMASDDSHGSLDAFELVLSAGMARWPQLKVDREILARHLAETPAPISTSPTFAAERYLTVACAAGIPHAAEIFQKFYADAIEGGVRSVTPEQVEEVR